MEVESTSVSTNDNGEKVEEIEDGAPQPKHARREKVPIPEGMSRNQFKKLKRSENWLGKRQEKRMEERARKKAKREQLKEEGRGEELKRKKLKKMEESQCKTRLAIDMSFDDKMNAKDQKRTCIQLAWAYSANRRVDNPLQYHIVNFNGASREHFNKTYFNWDAHLHTASLDETFKKEEIVYLTSDSDNVLECLDDSKVYVIGGIVDHNSEKFLCYNIAKERGYGHARLPIDEFIQMKTREVLTINQVFEILVRFSEGKTWEEAFFSVIPQRKGAQKKELESTDGTKCDGDGEVRECVDEEDADEEEHEESEVKEEEEDGWIEGKYVN